MRSVEISRRAVMASLGAAVLGSIEARAEAYRRFRSVSVDVKPLAAGGDTFSAKVIAETLPSWAQRYFGPFLSAADRSAPTLVLRVDTTYYGVAGSANGLHGDQAMDYLDGAGVVVGAAGRVLATYPITCSLHALTYDYDFGGAMARHRAESLGQSLAQFLPAKMGL